MTCSFNMSATHVLDVESKEKPIYEGHSSYYNPITKKWQSGTFTLHRRHLEFLSEEERGKPPFHLSLPLCTLSSIKKKHTYVIYSALVIEVGSEVHWFSSFQNRDSVYNLLELFWRNSLFSRYTCSKSQVTASTPLLNRLLVSLHESEDTLTSAAKALDEQDQELDELEEDVENLNAELTTAEKLLKSLDSPKSSHAVDDSIVTELRDDDSDIKKFAHIRKKKYQITFTNSETPNCSSSEWDKGFVTVSGEIEVLDEEENIIIHLPSAKVQAIVMVSPWEICITEDCGAKQIHHNIMCPMLTQLHKYLTSSPVFGDKIMYKDDTECAFPSTSGSSGYSSTSSSGSCTSLSVAELSTKVQTVGRLISPNISQVLEQVEKAHSSGSLLDEEAEQITAVLNNLQTLATEVNKEQECQMEKIKKLVTDVDKTELRINSENRTLRKLT